MIGLSSLEPKSGVSGLVHLYVGDGKGKTTAAVGLAVRAVGHEEPVLFCQFLKGRETGEIAQLRALGIEVQRAKTGERFFFQLSPAEQEELRKTHGQCLQEAAQAAAEGRYRLIVLDEVVDAANCGAVEYPALLALLAGRAPGVELVLTGRNPDPQLVEQADYLTEFVCRKHPYQRGIAARAGVEY